MAHSPLTDEALAPYAAKFTATGWHATTSEAPHAACPSVITPINQPMKKPRTQGPPDEGSVTGRMSPIALQAYRVSSLGDLEFAWWLVHFIHNAGRYRKRGR